MNGMSRWRNDILLRPRTAGAVLLVLGAAIWSTLHLALPPSLDDRISVTEQMGHEALNALSISYACLIGAQCILGRKVSLSAGEMLGAGLGVFLSLVLAASLITPEGQLTLLVFYYSFPLLVGMFLLAIGLLIGTVIGKRNHLPCRFTDRLGIALVVTNGVVVSLVLHFRPMAW